MKTILAVLLLFFASSAAFAVDIPLGWETDGSPTVTYDAYRIYTCTDAAATVCTKADLGVNPTTVIQQAVNTSRWYYVTAFKPAIAADSSDIGYTYSGGEVESPRSNILHIVVSAPPGKPNNIKIRASTTPGTAGLSVKSMVTK